FDNEINIHSNLIHSDLNELEKSNFARIDIVLTGEGMRNYYYFDGHKFEQQELRLMMDAVVSAQVITETEKENIIKKIKTLTSKATAESLQNQIHINKSASSTNQEVKYHISKLHEAIHDEKII